jgi:hypothetical protein
MSPKRKDILSISSATFLENLAASRPELLHVLFQAIRNIVIIAFRVTTISQHVGSARLLLLQRTLMACCALRGNIRRRHDK